MWITMILISVVGPQLFAQDDMRPEYVVITRTHWNFELDDDDASPEEWEALAKEYLEKVVKKNDHVKSTATLAHLYTEDNSEVLMVATYKTWADIEKAQAKYGELEDAAWPDEAAADAFFKRLDRYYVNKHSDEIYRTLDGAKLPAAQMDSSMVVYMQKVYLAFPEDGSNEEFNQLRVEYANKVIHKSPHVKAYYPLRHAWGAANRELVQVYGVESLCDVAEMNQTVGGLVREAWPDEAARDAFFDKYDKYFTGKHADYLYSSIPEVAK